MIFLCLWATIYFDNAVYFSIYDFSFIVLVPDSMNGLLFCMLIAIGDGRVVIFFHISYVLHVLVMKLDVHFVSLVFFVMRCFCLKSVYLTSVCRVY